MTSLIMPFSLIIHLMMIAIAFTFAQHGNVAMTGFWLFLSIRFWSMAGAMYRAWTEAGRELREEERDAET